MQKTEFRFPLAHTLERSWNKRYCILCIFPSRFLRFFWFLDYVWKIFLKFQSCPVHLRIAAFKGSVAFHAQGQSTVHHVLNQVDNRRHTPLSLQFGAQRPWSKRVLNVILWPEKYPFQDRTNRMDPRSAYLFVFFIDLSYSFNGGKTLFVFLATLANPEL